MATFSHSRISAFETCPKKYEFSYVLKAPRGPEGIEAFMGSRVHEALEWLYDQVRACRVPDEAALLARFTALWDESWDESCRVARAGRTADDYRAIGEKALRDYHARYRPFDQGVTVGLEARIGLRLDDEHEIMGYVDRITKVSDGVWEIHDYKTSGTLPTQRDADEDRQLALYEIGLREMYADVRDVTLVWHYLAFDQEVRSTRTPEQLERLKADVLRAVQEIEAQREFATKASALCDWCDFQQMCPAWSHKFHIEELPESERASEDGVALVDEYLAVSDELARLKGRQDSLKEAIAGFATDRGLERVFGTTGSLKVYRYPQIGIPDAKDPRRSEFEGLLRELGMWERFASLSGYSLSRAIQDGDIDRAQLDRIEPYLSHGEGVKLYPARR